MTEILRNLLPMGNVNTFSSKGKISSSKQTERLHDCIKDDERLKESLSKPFKSLEYADCKQDDHSWGGAHDGKVAKQQLHVPQTPSDVKAEVTSHLTDLEAKKNSKDLEEKKALLLFIAKSHNGCLDERAKKAIEFMLNKDESVNIIDLTAAYLHLKLGQAPTGTDVFRAMLECNLQENLLVKQLADFVKTETGALALKSLLDSSKEASRYQPTSNVDIKSSNPFLDLTVEELSSQTVSCEEDNKDSNGSYLNDSNKDSNISATSENNKTLNSDLIRRALLEKENATLKDRLLCRNCKQRPISVVLLPCGHFVLCSVCSEPCHVCPCCQAVVLAEKKTFLS